MTPLEIATATHDGGLTVQVKGEVDVSNADRVLDAVDEALRQAPARLLVDWSGVTFADSSGVRALIRTRRRCDEARAEFSLLASESVERVLKLVGLEDLGKPSDGQSPRT